MKQERKRNGRKLLSVLLTLVLAVGLVNVMSLPANAEGQTVVWSGEQAVTQDKPVSIDKDEFSGIKLGDKIVVEFKDANVGLLSLFSNGKCLPGTSYNDVGSGDSSYEVFATQDMIKSLKQYGMDVSGEDYTVTKVSYEAGRDNLDENTVWSGNFWMDSWSTLELSATSFSDVDWDEIEAIRFISEAGRSNWTLNIKSSWDDDGKIADQGSMTWKDNYFELDLENIDMAAKLQGKDRLLIEGNKDEGSAFSFTQVQLVPKPATPYPSAIDPAVEEVKKKINALPESDKITVNDKAAIEDAKAAYDKLTSEQKSQIPANILEKLEKSEKALANAEAEEAKEKKVKTVTVNVKTVSAKALDTAVKKAGGSEKYVTSFKLGKKVKKISKSAFKKYKKVTTLTLNTKKLKKKSVKGSLKDSSIKKIKVNVGSKKVNKKYVKKYKKIFTKKNAGKKVKVA